MPAQIEYYNRFGDEFKNDILACPEPHLWTTDYKEKGRVYQEIKERIAFQGRLVDKYLDKSLPVLDIGCGFGRQAYIMAKNGFTITGTDTSAVFINIAQELFKKNNLSGKFFCINILDEPLEERFTQVLVLDVLEHIGPAKRQLFIERIYGMTGPQGRLLLSLPHVKKRFTSQVNNRLRKRLTQHFSYFRSLEEHPYPIPQSGDIIGLTNQYFTLIELLTTPLTDYYVFEKR